MLWRCAVEVDWYRIANLLMQAVYLPIHLYFIIMLIMHRQPPQHPCNLKSLKQLDQLAVGDSHVPEVLERIVLHPSDYCTV